VNVLMRERIALNSSNHCSCGLLSTTISDIQVRIKSCTLSFGRRTQDHKYDETKELPGSQTSDSLAYSNA
jgi:hypothetical protein